MGKWYESTHAFSLTLSQPCIDDERMIIPFRSSFNIKYLAFTSLLLSHILSRLKYPNIMFYNFVVVVVDDVFVICMRPVLYEQYGIL